MVAYAFQVGDTRARKSRKCPHLTLRVPHRVLADKLVNLRIFLHALPCRRLLGRDRLRADHRVRRRSRAETAAKGGRARKGGYVNRLQDETARKSRQRAQVTVERASQQKADTATSEPEAQRGLHGGRQTGERESDSRGRRKQGETLGGCRTAAPACEIWRSSSAALMPARATRGVGEGGEWHAPSPPLHAAARRPSTWLSPGLAPNRGVPQRRSVETYRSWWRR
eukprot:COSAG04_NODE_1308_length_7288_cov_2.749339_1_plen_224_part_10